MKKWLYLAALLATCYLNLVYDWPEGRTILVVELVFPAVLYLEAKLMSVRIKIRPQGDLQMAEEGGDFAYPLCGGKLRSVSDSGFVALDGKEQEGCAGSEKRRATDVDFPVSCHGLREAGVGNQKSGDKGCFRDVLYPDSSLCL
ncbi:MAG: hypothetical protein ACLUUO_10190 [Sellimonas intestinalis]